MADRAKSINTEALRNRGALLAWGEWALREFARMPAEDRVVPFAVVDSLKLGAEDVDKRIAALSDAQLVLLNAVHDSELDANQRLTLLKLTEAEVARRVWGGEAVPR